MAIPLVKESEEERKEWGNVIENCYFKCGNKTIHWHWRTNQPVCPDCAKSHKVAELPKAHPDYKAPTKKEYLKSI